MIELEWPPGTVLHRGINAKRFAAVEREAFAMPWSAAAFSEASHRQGWWLAKNEVTIAFLYVQQVLEEAEILRIAVLPSERRQGLAMILWQAFCADRTHTWKVVHLEVAHSNLAARAFYLHLGFTVSGTRKDYYGPGDDALMMTWRRAS